MYTNKLKIFGGLTKQNLPLERMFLLRAAFYTLGCKVNQYETAALQEQFSNAGYEVVEPDELADVYVVNSCTVTDGGDKKSRQALRRMRRQNPAAVVCLCGCFPQAFPAEAGGIPEADVVMGAKRRGMLLGAVHKFLVDGERIVDVSPHGQTEEFEDLRAGRFISRTRAFLKIEDGCRRFCAYCIIPTARGPVRSKPPEEIRTELEALAEQGYREVVLAGVNLSCYGQDIGLRLIDAVRTACAVGGISRVRLSSLEPELLSRSDIAEMAKLEKLCPHFHLSLQSGCDKTLERMRRHYDTAEYRRIVENIRASFENAAITTDIMVGFPGETSGEFNRSLEFCRETGFARTHVFAYSKRPGTAAAEMPEQVQGRTKRERSRIMIEAAGETRADFLKTQVGKPAEILFETKRADGVWEGYSRNYTPVLLESNENLSGRILTVTLKSTDGEYCTATI